MKNFDEYIRQGEPAKAEKAKLWKTAIGLQKVDGLEPSEYLIATAGQHIEGEITIEQVQQRIDNYYQQHTVQNSEHRTEEADKVSVRITEILSEQSFTFSPAEYLNIHRRLFQGIYGHAGKIRNYNITKQEWILDGETIVYGSADSLKATLEYDFEQEKKFSYKGLSQQETIEHIVQFISYLWQIHVFGEGNTRTTAIFLIKYLRTFGYEVDNYVFEQHSWYFRNALVRANYNNLKKNIHATNEYLMRFFENLLMGEQHQLKNRDMHIRNTNPVKPKKDLVKPKKDLVKPEKDLVKPEKDLVKPEKDLVNDPVKLAILQCLQVNPQSNYAQIAIRSGYSVTTVKRHIQKLKKLGLLERVGSDKTGYWKIITQS